MEYGPFPSLLAAVQDMQHQDDADDEFGIADWVDPETGELAEDNVPRLEDH